MRKVQRPSCRRVYAHVASQLASRPAALSFLVPAIITGLVACGIMALSDDSPRGDLSYLYKEGVLARKTATQSARLGIGD